VVLQDIGSTPIICIVELRLFPRCHPTFYRGHCPKKGCALPSAQHQQVTRLHQVPDDFSSALKVIKDNLGTLISQNETLARGIVALAEKFEGEEKSPRESQSFIGAPSFGNRVAAPKPNFSFSAPPASPQPINLQKKKRTGLF